MKVIIKKSKSPYFWYSDKVGHVFDVQRKIRNYSGCPEYRLKEKPFFIHIEDAVVFSWWQFIKINFPFLIGKKKQTQRKF